MLISMTGFGKGSVADRKITAEAELKSLNSRFFDLSVKMPKNLSGREFEIRELVKSRINRGKLSLSIQLAGEDDEEIADYIISHKGLLKAGKVLQEIKKYLKIKESISIQHVLSLREFYLTENAEDSEEIFELVKKAVILATEDLLTMKRKEGNELYNDLRTRTGKINNYLEKIILLSEKGVEEYFEKTREKARLLVQDLKTYDDRLNLELALLAERYDITEECVRLRSHLKMFDETMEFNEEVGRKLNFITQEMNREANTINNKSLSFEISRQGISIKEEIEKIREQLQNIE